MCHLHLRVQLANDYIFLFKIHHFSQNPYLSNILCICIITYYNILRPPCNLPAQNLEETVTHQSPQLTPMVSTLSIAKLAPSGSQFYELPATSFPSLGIIMMVRCQCSSSAYDLPTNSVDLLPKQPILFRP